MRADGFFAYFAILIFCKMLTTSEFGAGYSGCHRYVERFGCRAVGRVAWDKKTIVYVLSTLGSNSVAFIAHYYYSVAAQLFTVYVLSVEECAVYGRFPLYRFKELRQ